METYGLNQDEAIAVLRFFHWDEEKLQESWFDNEAKLRQQIGIQINSLLLKKMSKQ